MYQQVATSSVFNQLPSENLDRQSIQTLLQSSPQPNPVIAVLESLNASPKLKQQINDNRRIRVKRMRSQVHLAQKRSKKFACTQTESTDTQKPNVLQSYAAQTPLERYQTKTLVEGMQPTFTPSALMFSSNNAPTDLSMEWDGSLWALDNQGTPRIYDPINYRADDPTHLACEAWLRKLRWQFAPPSPTVQTAFRAIF